jgi:hypothetical protein
MTTLCGRSDGRTNASAVMHEMPVAMPMAIVLTGRRFRRIPRTSHPKLSSEKRAEDERRPRQFD